jgi:hypothetical protein
VKLSFLENGKWMDQNIPTFFPLHYIITVIMSDPRSKLLSNLAKSYGAKSSASAKIDSSRSQNSPVSPSPSPSSSYNNASNKRARNTLSSPRPSTTETLETIFAAVGCTENASTRRFFTDTLDGKSIVLSNTSKQISAASVSNRNKSHLKQKKRISLSSLQSKGIWNPMEITPRMSDLKTAYKLWSQFVISIMDTCSNEAQLQARFHSFGLLGAKITLLKEIDESSMKMKMKRKMNDRDRDRDIDNERKNNDTAVKQRMLSGYVVYESTNCVYIAHKVKSDSDSDSGNEDEGDFSISVYRAIKKCSEIAVPLPLRFSHKSSGNTSKNKQIDGSIDYDFDIDISNASKIIVLRGNNIV